MSETRTSHHEAAPGGACSACGAESPTTACSVWPPFVSTPASPAARAGTLPIEAVGPTIHDGGITDPVGCPRGLRQECAPLARYASPGVESFMCCGETSAAPVPTDRLRLCVLSTHATGVDVLVNFDERDAVHTASVLLAGLSALGSVRITATDRLPTPTPEAP